MNFVLIASTGHKNAIARLIEKGANVNAAENKWKMSPLHYVATLDPSFDGHEHWTEDNSLSNFNFTSTCVPFSSLFQTEVHVSNNKNNFPIGFAQLLIDHGAYVNAKDSDDKTPFDIAYSEKSNVHKQYSKYWHALFKNFSLVKLK